MNRKAITLITLGLSLMLLNGCSTQRPTGNPAGAVAGGIVGAGGAALLGASKPVLFAAGIAGAAVGYYVTTLSYASNGVILACGQVYQVGQRIGINIPSDQLFVPNTDEFKSSAIPILDSAAAILERYPNNNIIISGNTSGFYTSRWEQALSERRAQKVAAYMWNAGINQFRENSNYATRKLTYVGYGNYFPIASDLTNEGIRKNSHIQITSYPANQDLLLKKKNLGMDNDGAYTDEDCRVMKRGSCYKD